MAANTSPIFTLTPQNNWGKVTGADTGTDGTDADVVLICTFGSNAGGFIQKLIFQPISTSGSTTTSAAAARIYINNGSTVGTATNNLLFKEITLAATAVNTAATAAALGYELPFNFQCPISYRIYCGITAMAANTQWNVLAITGDY